MHNTLNVVINSDSTGISFLFITFSFTLLLLKFEINLEILLLTHFI